MIFNDKGQAIIFDAFIRENFLYLISTYRLKSDPPMDIRFNNEKMKEMGRNRYEPNRYFVAPYQHNSNISLIETMISIIINGQEYSFNVPIIQPKKKGFAIATLFKDDYDQIDDFVKYYRKQGVEKFYLYYNGPELPNDLPQGSDIYYNTWDFQYWNHTDWYNWSKGWTHNAQASFITMIQIKYLKDHNWLGLIDLDEWIYPVKTNTILEALQSNNKSQVVMVQNYWAIRNNQEIKYHTKPLSWETRTKCFYNGDKFQGWCGIHAPKNCSSVNKNTDLLMFHLIYGEEERKKNRLAFIKDPINIIRLNNQFF